MSGRISEEVASEIEVLNAIYEGDFLPRPPVWNLPSFAIRIQPVISEGEKPVRVVGKRISPGVPPVTFPSCLLIRNAAVMCVQMMRGQRGSSSLRRILKLQSRWRSRSTRG